MKLWNDYLIFSILVTAIFTTCSGNIFVCRVIIYKRLFKNPIWYYLFSLALSDIFASVTVIPLMATAVYNEHVLEDQHLCNTSGSFTLTLSVWSIFTIAAISLYKRANLQSYVIKKKKSIVCFLSYLFIVVMTSAGFSAPAILGYSEYTHFEGRKWCYLYSTDPQLHMYFMISIVVVGYVVPVILIVICNTSVFMYVRKMVEKQRETISGDHQEAVLKRRQIKVLKLSLLVVLTFLLMWSPTIILILIGASGKQVTTSYSIISYTVMFFQGSINPIIYCFRHATFKKEFKKIYLKRRNTLPRSSITDTTV